VDSFVKTFRNASFDTRSAASVPRRQSWYAPPRVERYDLFAHPIASECCERSGATFQHLSQDKSNM